MTWHSNLFSVPGWNPSKNGIRVAQLVVRRLRFLDNYTYYKKRANQLARGYELLGWDKRAQKVAGCGSWITFIEPKETGISACLNVASEMPRMRLFYAEFCRDKLCPLCSYRRSRKYAYENMTVVKRLLEKRPKAKFVLVTITQRNVPGEQLQDELGRMSRSFNVMMQRKDFKKNPSILGYIKNVEVTYNKKEGDYHPHMHILLAVAPKYFTDHRVTKQTWKTHWREVMKLDYMPVLDISIVKNREIDFDDDFDNTPESLSKAIFEVSKYATKPFEFKEENIEIIEKMYLGTRNKRQISFGGVLKELRREMKLDESNNKSWKTDNYVKVKGESGLIMLNWNSETGKYTDLGVQEVLIRDEDDIKEFQKDFIKQKLGLF